MRRILMIALATAAIGITSTPASAVILQQCGSGASCVSGTTNVNLQGNVNDPGALQILGNVGPVTGPLVTFTSSNGLLDANSGAATIFRPGDALLTQLTFTLQSGFSFSKAEFDLLSGAPKVFDVVLTTSSGATNTIHVDNSNGSNVFNVIGQGSESFTSASFSSTAGDIDGGFATFKQLRLVMSTGQPIPEPATWAMMLLGFGGIGMAMRRSRKSNGRLLQVA
jgi:hypothetical protein